MFAGLCAFPLTLMDERGIDDAAFTRLITRLAEAGVDSIGALGSTGNYAYLTRQERSRVARLAVKAAAGAPVMVGVGAARTAHVLALAEDAQQAGAAALLLAGGRPAAPAARARSCSPAPHVLANLGLEPEGARPCTP